jgi:long-subunit acyl-CoA synthetase (AMP-forming)
MRRGIASPVQTIYVTLSYEQVSYCFADCGSQAVIVASQNSQKTISCLGNTRIATHSVVSLTELCISLVTNQ